MTIILVGVALIVGFALGAVLGFGAYHLGRQTNKYLPVYKVNDNERQRTKALAEARKIEAEVAAMQTAYLGGVQLDRESYLAGSKK